MVNLNLETSHDTSKVVNENTAINVSLKIISGWEELL